jgi:hypothetical protein
MWARGSCSDDTDFSQLFPQYPAGQINSAGFSADSYDFADNNPLVGSSSINPEYLFNQDFTLSDADAVLADSSDYNVGHLIPRPGL